MGKSCKLPFNQNLDKARFLFHNIHCDLWGPVSMQSVQNFQYHVIFIDEFSRFTWFYHLKRKSYLFNCFQKFHKMFTNQFEKNIKIFQCNGRGEFTNIVFIEYLALREVM